MPNCKNIAHIVGINDCILLPDASGFVAGSGAPPW